MPKNSLDSRCLLKAGVPFVQQRTSYNNINWPSELMFEGGVNYSSQRGAFAYSLVGSGLAVEYFDNTINGNLYRNLASQVYGENDIHILWALIVAPEDVEVESELSSQQPGTFVGNNRKVSWGMMQGFNFADESGIPQEIVKEPTYTFPMDGLLNTRIHDATSKQNPNIWHRGSFDSNAYNRFSFGSGPLWGPEVNKEELSSSKTAFKQAYSAMWDEQNPLDSALRQISILNETNSYGHNDWYIPSIIELNYIFAAKDELNGSIAANGDQIMGGEEYWSSTSVSLLKHWDSFNPLDKDHYELETINSQIEPHLASNRFTSTNNTFNMNEDAAYSYNMAVSNGQKMLTQTFN